jgi:hypothetical protein
MAPRSARSPTAIFTSLIASPAFLATRATVRSPSMKENRCASNGESCIDETFTSGFTARIAFGSIMRCTSAAM